MIIIIITRKADMVICFVSLEKITEITGSDMIEELSPRKEHTPRECYTRLMGFEDDWTCT